MTIANRKILSLDNFIRLQQEIRPLTAFFDVFDKSQVVITDEFANIIYVNNAVEKITGYSINETIGKTPGDLWGGYEKDSFYDNLWKTIRDRKQSFTGYVTNKKKDLTPIHQQLNILPILDDKENIIFYIAVEPVVVDSKTRMVLMPEKLDLFLKQMMNRKLTLSDVREEIEKLSK